jgi:ABC-type multidrug transport system ATPase subunit
MNAEVVLKVEDLTKIYRSRRRGDIKAVDNVSFSVYKNEVVGLLGPNGAGKTTTIKSICTILRPTSGEIEIDFPLTVTGKLSKRELRGTVGESLAEIRIKTSSGDIRINKK